MSGERSPTMRVGDVVFLRVLSRELEGCIFSEHASCVAVLPKWNPKAALPNVHFATFKVEVAKRDRAQQKRLQGTPVLYGEKIQFVHTLTSKYLAVDITSVSQTEDTNLKLELVDKAQLKSGCQLFRIVPPNDVRSLGDDVGFGEQFKVESVRIRGYYVHCSEQQFEMVSSIVNKEFYELNLSALCSKDCIVSVEPHYQVRKGDDNIFKAGVTVQIVHHKSSAYVAAEGSFATGQLSKDVHCQVSSSSGGTYSRENTSADTYWQFEKYGEPCSGDQFQWGTESAECRIKHLPTRMYLTVRQDGGNYECMLVPEELATSAWPKAPKIVIQDLSSFIDSDDGEEPVVKQTGLTSEDPLKFAIASPLTQTGDAAICVKESFVCLKHVATGKWLCLDKDKDDSWGEGERTRKLTVCDSMAYEDAFVLNQVSEALMVLFNTLAGVVPGLKDCTQNVKWHAERGDSHGWAEMIAMLEELLTFMNHGDPSREVRKRREKLLRNLGVLPLIVSVIEKHDPDSPDAEKHDVVYRTCFEVIRTFLKSGSTKNKNFLKDWFQLFLSKLHWTLHAEEVVISMIQDNREILSAVSDDNLSAVVHYLTTAEKPDHRLLLLLANLCMCDGSPILEKQTLLLRSVVATYGKKLFYPIVEGTTQVCFVHPVTKKEFTPKDFSPQSSRQDSNFTFVLTQLEFFAALCKGDNRDAVIVLCEGDHPYFTFAGLLQFAEEVGAHPHLRSRCLELIKVAFVNVGTNCSIKNNLCIDYNVVPANDVPDRNKDQPLFGVSHKNFSSLKLWILHYLQLMNDDAVLELLNEQVLELLALLVTYGYYYQRQEVDLLMSELVSYLSDTAGKFNPSKGTVRSPTVLRRCMEVLSELFEVQLYLELQVLVSNFRQREDVMALDSSTPSSPGGVSSPLSPNGANSSVTRRTKTAERYSKLCSDLADQYCSKGWPDTLKASLRLLDQLHSFESTLIKRSLEVELVVSASSRSDLEEVTNTLQLAKHRLTLGCAGVSKELNQLAELCSRPNEDSPDQRVQKLLVSSGLLAVLLDYVADQAQRSKTIKPDDPSDLQSVFVLLAMMAHGNSKVQQRLYKEFDSFIVLGSALCGVPMPADPGDPTDQKLTALPFLAEMLTAVFTGMSELCLQVDEEQIGSIFKLIARSKEDVVGQIVLLSTLNTIAKVERLSVPNDRKQEIIVRHFNRMKREFCRDLLCDSGFDLVVHRLKLLRKINPSRGQQMLLSVTDLLATCSEGENIHIDSMCQTIFEAEELLDILLKDAIPIARKIPFARFLVTVYMDVLDESGPSVLFRKRKLMMKWLKYIANFLKNLCKALQDIPQQDHHKVCRGLTRARWSHFYSLYDNQCKLPQCEHPADIPTTGGAPVTTGDGTLVEGVLTFLMEAAVPAVKVFYSKCFNGFKSEHSHTHQSLLETTREIFDNLQNLFPVISKFFSAERQVKLFQSTILCLICADTTLQNSLPNEDDLMRSYGAVEPSEEDKLEAQLGKEFKTYIQGVAEARGIMLMKEGSSVDVRLPECLRLPTRDSGLSEMLSQFRKPNSLEPTAAAISVLLRYLKGCAVRRVREKDVYLEVRILQLLRIMLQDFILEAGPKLRITSPEKFRKRCTGMKKLQDSLSEKEAIDIVLPLTAHPSEEVSREALAVLTAILYAGNKEVQKELIALLQRDPSRVENCTNVARVVLPKAMASYKSRQSVLEVVLSGTKEQQLLVKAYRNLQAKATEGQRVPAQGVGDSAIDIEGQDRGVGSGTTAMHQECASKLQEQDPSVVVVREQVQLEELPPDPLNMLAVPSDATQGTQQYDFEEDDEIDTHVPYDLLSPSQIRALSTDKLKRLTKDLEERKDDAETGIKTAKKDVQLSHVRITELEAESLSTELEIVQVSAEIEQLDASVHILREQCAQTTQETEQRVGVARQSLKELHDSAEEVIADLEDLENLDIEADNLFNKIHICVHKSPPQGGVQPHGEKFMGVSPHKLDPSSSSVEPYVPGPPFPGPKGRRPFRYQSTSPVRLEIERSQLAEKALGLRDELDQLEQEYNLVQAQLAEVKRSESEAEKSLERLKERLEQLKDKERDLRIAEKEETVKLSNLKKRQEIVEETIEMIEKEKQSLEEKKAELLEDRSNMEDGLAAMRTLYSQLQLFSGDSPPPEDLIESADEILGSFERSGYAKQASNLKDMMKELEEHLEPPAPQKVEEVSTEAHDASTQGAALEESPTGSTVQLIGPSPQQDKHEPSPAVSLISVPLTKEATDVDEMKITAALMKSADFSRAKLSLELLGSMCDGQNRDLQNYLREQPGHIKPVNMVGEIALFIQHFFSGTSFSFHHDRLKRLCPETGGSGADVPDLTQAVKDWRRESLVLIDKILHTLIELSVGNYQNQEVIYERQIIDALNAVFRCRASLPTARGEVLSLEEIQLIKVKSSAVELLEVMMEETDDDSRQLKDSICGAIDSWALSETMREFYQLQGAPQLLRHEEGGRQVSNDETVELLFGDDITRALFRTHYILVSCQLEPPREVTVKLSTGAVEVTWKPPGNSREVTGYTVTATSEDGSEVWTGKTEPSDTNVIIDVLDLATVKRGGYKFSVAAMDHTRVPSPVMSSDEAWRFCEKRSRSIEVFYTNEEDEKVLTRVHFQYDKEDELRKELRTEVKWNVNRESPEEKVRDFVTWSKACKKDIDHQKFLRSFWLLFYLTHQGTSQYRHRILLFLTFVINLLVLISLMVPSSELPASDQDRFNPDNVSFDLTPFVPDFDGLWYWPIIHFILGPIHLFFSLWMAVEFFFVSLPHFSPKPPNWAYKLVGRKPPDEEYFEVRLFGGKTFYILLFVLCSFLGLVLWGYFYCICLLHIVSRNDSLKRVLRAITKGGEQLLWLALLGLFVLYIYSVISFAFIHEAFLVESDDVDLFCRSLGECFISVIRYGLIDGLGLNVPLVSGNFSESGERLIYDLAFFIIVSTIGLDMVTGIIVDAFGELRDEKWKAKDDMENNCFICGNPRHKFDRISPEEFDRHIKYDHRQWDYIYYFVYLGRIDTSDHNAIEKQVYDTFERGHTDFFPLGDALSLRLEETTLEDKVDSLATRMEELSRDASSRSEGRSKDVEDKVDFLAARIEGLSRDLASLLERL